jgi:hypothetical protein
MPTIEVGEFDKVFVVRRTETQLPKGFQQVVEVSEDDLLVFVQQGHLMTDTPIGKPARGAPKARVFIGGDQIGVLNKVRVEADSDNPLPIMEFSIISPLVEGLTESTRNSVQKSLDNLKKLLPLATIHEMGFKGVELATHGRDLTLESVP